MHLLKHVCLLLIFGLFPQNRIVLSKHVNTRSSDETDFHGEGLGITSLFQGVFHTENDLKIRNPLSPCTLAAPRPGTDEIPWTCSSLVTLDMGCLGTILPDEYCSTCQYNRVPLQMALPNRTVVFPIQITWRELPQYQSYKHGTCGYHQSCPGACVTQKMPISLLVSRRPITMETELTWDHNVWFQTFDVPAFCICHS